MHNDDEGQCKEETETERVSRILSEHGISDTNGEDDLYSDDFPVLDNDFFEL